MSNSLSSATIEAMAPDQPSLKAAVGLMKPAKWPLRQSDGDFIWAECQGSGANPYRVIFDLRDHGNKCTCPSRKFPCKHILAMALMYAGAAGDFGLGSLPDWGSDWIGRRRKSTATDSGAANIAKPANDLSAALAAEPEQETDPKKLAALEAARVKRAEATKQAQLAGLQELEGWIADNLSLGLPQALSNLPERCRLIAARLADAKAAALSGRIDELPERVLSLPNAARIDALIDELGKLVLLARAARIDPQPIGVQRLISAAESRDTVLQDPAAAQHEADWLVVACHVRNRKDGLISYATWLISSETLPRFALLQDFLPASLGKRGAGFSVGQSFHAKISFFPSNYPLRAVIADRSECASDRTWGNLGDCRSQIARAFAAEPWIQDLPLTLDQGRIASDAQGGFWWQGKDGICLPIAQTSFPSVALAMDLVGTAALWRNGRLVLLASHSAMGVLHYDE